jgi:threonine dehydratase
MSTKLSRTDIEQAHERIRDVITRTPLSLCKRLSEQYGAEIYLKREDLQPVRSYKIRGAYHAIVSLSPDVRARGIVCASAGNHAQGVALACERLGVAGFIYMPKNTPKQKIERVRILGKDRVVIELVGDTFDDASAHAREFCTKGRKTYIHPFDDLSVIAGQGTVGLELIEQTGETPIDIVVVPVGGGGLIAGLGTYMKDVSPDTQVIGVEPEGAPSMTRALEAGKPVTLDTLDTFVDGVAVRTVGQETFAIAADCVDTMRLVSVGQVCEDMIALYQSEGIVTEPAGALSVAALLQLQEEIRGKRVVCIISGGNNDISRYPEVMERSLIHRGLKHYFLVEFSQRPGALREYLDHVLGVNDDITLFEYMKKSNKETGPALVGLELMHKEDLAPLLARMDEHNIRYERVDHNSPFFRFLL